MSSPVDILRRAARVMALCMLTGMAQAQVEGLYEGEVPVASEEEAERTAAIGEALRQVLTKLTGVAIPAGRQVDVALADPLSYMQQFSYRQGETPEARLLWARFDPAAVDALVRDAALPQWSAQRPVVVAWIAVNSSGTVDIVAPEGGIDEGGVAAALSREAWRQGVPLRYPLLDLEDRVKVQADNVWNLDVVLLREVSARYTPGALLAGRIEADAALGWVGRWRYEEGGQVSDFQTGGDSPAAVTTGVMSRIARQLAARYAVAAELSDPGGVDVRVSGVRTLGDYARVLEYLRSLDQVSGLAFRAARGEEFQFRMRVRGGAEALRRLASFGGVLADEPGTGDAATVRFRLLP